MKWNVQQKFKFWHYFRLEAQDATHLYKLVDRINMKQTQLVLWEVLSWHNSVHRQTDRQTDRWADLQGETHIPHPPRNCVRGVQFYWFSLFFCFSLRQMQWRIVWWQAMSSHLTLVEEYLQSTIKIKTFWHGNVLKILSWQQLVRIHNDIHMMWSVLSQFTIISCFVFIFQNNEKHRLSSFFEIQVWFKWLNIYFFRFRNTTYRE